MCAKPLLVVLCYAAVADRCTEEDEVQLLVGLLDDSSVCEGPLSTSHAFIPFSRRGCDWDECVCWAITFLLLRSVDHRVGEGSLPSGCSCAKYGCRRAAS